MIAVAWEVETTSITTALKASRALDSRSESPVAGPMLTLTTPDLLTRPQPTHTRSSSLFRLIIAIGK